MKKVMLIVMLCVFSLTSPVAIYAIDNDDLGDAYWCRIILNGEPLSTSGDNVVFVGPNRTTPVEAYLTSEAVATLGSSPLRISVEPKGPITGNWIEGALTCVDTTDVNFPKKCTGSFTLGSSFWQHVRDIDIETTSGTPICKRASAKIINIQRNYEVCTAIRDSLRNAIITSNSPTNDHQVPINTEAVLSFNINYTLDEIEENCGYDSLYYVLKYEGNEEQRDDLVGGENVVHFTPFHAGDYEIEIFAIKYNYCVATGYIVSVCMDLKESFASLNFCAHSEGNTCEVTLPEEERESKFNLCDQIPGEENDEHDTSTPRGKCKKCEDGEGIWTAVGCIQHNPGTMVQTLIQIGLSVAGGIALLMIMVSGFMFTTSKGDPKRTTEAKEILQSAIIGLLFIIFSVTILQFVGVTILQIPGFGSEQ